MHKYNRNRPSNKLVKTILRLDRLRSENKLTPINLEDLKHDHSYFICVFEDDYDRRLGAYTNTECYLGYYVDQHKLVKDSTIELRNAIVYEYREYSVKGVVKRDEEFMTKIITNTIDTGDSYYKYEIYEANLEPKERGDVKELKTVFDTLAYYPENNPNPSISFVGSKYREKKTEFEKKYTRSVKSKSPSPKPSSKGGRKTRRRRQK